MSTSSLPNASSIRESIVHLFSEKSPVLIEVRFPNMGASSDWFLCEDEEDLDPILERLAPGVEVHLNSVWEMRNPTGGIVWKK